MHRATAMGNAVSTRRLKKKANGGAVDMEDDDEMEPAMEMELREAFELFDADGSHAIEERSLRRRSSC